MHNWFYGYLKGIGVASGVLGAWFSGVVAVVEGLWGCIGFSRNWEAGSSGIPESGWGWGILGRPSSSPRTPPAPAKPIRSRRDSFRFGLEIDWLTPSGVGTSDIVCLSVGMERWECQQQKKIKYCRLFLGCREARGLLLFCSGGRRGSWYEWQGVCLVCPSVW